MILEVRKNISVLQIQPEIPWLQKPVPCVSCAELIRSHYITYFCVAQSCSLIIWAGLGFSRYKFSMRAVRVADYVIPDGFTCFIGFFTCMVELIMEWNIRRGGVILV